MRVFVSSTFKDMQTERDELVKRVFPALRELCDARGVAWGEVDLRWGITDEQQAEGRVLPICLEEIRNCRPFFIGLLGERYGWVPDELEPALVQREPWLAEYEGRSVTELEIVHGVLADPQMADHAFFYFRDKSYRAGDPTFGWEPDDDEIRRLGLERAWQQARLHHERLAELKQRIRTSGLPVHENYSDPQTLGDLVREDLTGVVERLFPAGSEPSPLEREHMLHDAFARNRAHVYVSRPGYFERLDAHVTESGPPLVVLGESGVGKSALLSNWVLRLTERHDAALLRGETDVPFVVAHFIGASPASADWAVMLRRLISELVQHFELPLDLSDDPFELPRAFVAALQQTAGRGRVVLLLDALNQLENRDGAPDLLWLPAALPANVRLIVSTLPGRPLEEIRRRGWPPLEVSPLDGLERERLIDEYLVQYAKQLPKSQVREIVAATQTRNPLFLRALLEELRIYGEHEKLERHIAWLLAAPDIPTLFELILTRWQNDYERDHPGLVGEAMTLLWAARRGLAEAELLDLLGASGDPLPGAIWSPLYLAAKHALANHEGLLGFAHEHVRAAVERRFVTTDDAKRAAHRQLARYFAQPPQQDPRKLEELPWQLAQAQDWQDLYQLLGDVDFAVALHDVAPFELLANWTLIERRSPLRMTDAYGAILERPPSEHALTIAGLLRVAGHVDEAIVLLRRVIEERRRSGSPGELAMALSHLAPTIRDRGDLDGALAMEREAEALYRQDGALIYTAGSLNNQGLIFSLRGEPDLALSAFDSAARFYRDARRLLFDERAAYDKFSGEKKLRTAHQLIDAPLAGVLGNLAVIHMDRAELDQAWRLLDESERIARELSDVACLIPVLGNKALIRYRKGDPAGALALHAEEERLSREIGDIGELAGSLDNQGVIFRDAGDLDRALTVTDEAERLLRQLSRPRPLARCLGNRAGILFKLEQVGQAVDVLTEQASIFRELADWDAAADVHERKASILRRHGDLAGSLAALKEQEEVLRTGSSPRLGRSLARQAEILLNSGDLSAALSSLEDAAKILRRTGDLAALQAVLGNMALIHGHRGDAETALSLHEEEERITRQIDDDAGLAESLKHQAEIHLARGDLDRAQLQNNEAEQLFRRLNSPNQLASCLETRASILRARGDLAGALTVLDELEEVICQTPLN